MAYSKAPWKATYNAAKERGVRNEGGFICFLPKPHHYTGQDARYEEELHENKANAMLIALAPEMMELLQDIAFRRRGTAAHDWNIEDAAEAAAEIILRFNTSISPQQTPPPAQ